MQSSRFIIVSLLFLASLESCKQSGPETSGTLQDSSLVEHISQRVEKPTLQHLLDSCGLRGSFVFYDPQIDTYYSNDFAWAEKGQLPASTYKIPHSIIAFETRVVEDTSTRFPWDGEPRALAMWETDMVFKQAFARSCVPCYQQVAQKIGVKRMQEWLAKLNYGQMEVDSSNLDMFWLRGASRISPMEQIDFLLRLKEGTLPIAARTYDLMKEMMFIVERPTYTLYGKTGWSNENGHHNGWFVGYLKRSDGKFFFFANNFEPLADYDMSQFAEVRRALSHQACQHLGMIP